MLQKIEIVYLSGSMVLKTNLNMINMVLMFIFSVSDQTFPFCVNFVKNSKFPKFKNSKDEIRYQDELLYAKFNAVVHFFCFTVDVSFFLYKVHPKCVWGNQNHHQDHQHVFGESSHRNSKLSV